jgi:hypothetical protein
MLVFFGSMDYSDFLPYTVGRQKDPKDVEILEPTVNVQNRFYKSCSRKIAQSYTVSSRIILSPFQFSGKNGLLEEEEEEEVRQTEGGCSPMPSILRLSPAKTAERRNWGGDAFG